MSKIYIWQGKLDKSLSAINKALIINANEKEALDLKKKIDLARSNWLIIEGNYFKDDQPLTRISPSIVIQLSPLNFAYPA